MVAFNELSGLYPMSRPTLREVHFGQGIRAWICDQSRTPAGSHKYWPARFIAESWKHTGKIGLGERVVILSSSGRMGIAFAQATADVSGLTLYIVTDVLSSVELTDALGTFAHVKVEIVNNPDPSGSHILARYAKIDEITKAFPEALILDQYGDFLIPLAYEETLVEEVLSNSVGEVGAVFCAAGTAGHGFSFVRYQRTTGARFKVFLVDSPGSKLWQKQATDRRRFPAYGNGRSTTFSVACEDINPIFVTDVEVVRACNFLLDHETLCVGPSSGAVAAAFIKLAWTHPTPLPHTGIPVLIFPDAGDAYRNTLWNEDWLITNGLGKAIKGP